MTSAQLLVLRHLLTGLANRSFDAETIPLLAQLALLSLPRVATQPDAHAEAAEPGDDDLAARRAR